MIAPEFPTHLEARQEMFDAAAWYEAERAELGHEFVAEVVRAVAAVMKAPYRFPLHLSVPGVRKTYVARFPYTVFYLECDGGVFILAVAHQRRRPNYWRGRV